MPPAGTADRVWVWSATVTATLEPRERRAWIRRAPNPADRRSTLVEITPEGRAMTDRLLPGIRVVERSMMATLTKTERKQLVELLDRVLKRSAELAAEPPTRLEGRRLRPQRLS